MSDETDVQLRLIEKVSNQGVRYNNSLIDEFFDKYMTSISTESIVDKSDEELIEVTRSNWVHAYIYGIYVFEGKKIIVDRGWEINADMFEYFRPQFEGAYREASLGFGQMVGDTMKVIFGSRPHLKQRLNDFVENERLMKELQEEAKIRASKNPHAGLSGILNG